MKKTLCILMLGLFLGGCGNQEVEKIQLQEPETVSAIQMISLRLKVEDFGRAKLAMLMKDIETAEMEFSEEIRRSKDFGSYYTVALTYEDETVDVFYFFMDNEDWYFETAEGIVYKDADFLDKYISIESEKEINSDAYTKTEVIEVPQALLEYAEQTGEEDINYYYSLLMHYYINEGFSEQQADAMAFERMIKGARIYEYAKESGYSISRENGKEKVWGYLVEEVNQDIEQDIKQEFRDGLVCKVRDTECWSVEEYWNTYYNMIICPETQEYVENVFLPRYEAAKQFFKLIEDELK